MPDASDPGAGRPLRHVPTLTEVVEDAATGSQWGASRPIGRPTLAASSPSDPTDRVVEEVLALLRPEVERAVRKALAQQQPAEVKDL